MAATKKSSVIERATLSNGLRVVIAPDRSSPVVGVNVSYDVGFRSEPEGRTGFAHLFEHLMFQGSENVGKMEHASLIQGAGGVMNGSTHPDYTNYWEMLPTGALELALWLEADRMRAPRITQENLENQIAVVQEEIRVNVLNQPYGGFPWILLPPVAFDTFPNAHNGYGDFAELESATLEDCQSFFNSFYAPGNAVLVVAGDVEADAAMAMIEKHFGDVAKRRTPKRPSFDEPPLRVERRQTTVDPLAPQPALAAAYRSPDPVKDLDGFLASVVLAEVLSEGDASRLQRRMVLDDRVATSLSVSIGIFGDPFDGRGPMLFTFEAQHTPQIAADTLLQTLDEEVERLAVDGIPQPELDRVQARLTAQLLRANDSVTGRTSSYAVFELVHANPGLLLELPDRLAAVTAAEVQAVAATLQPSGRATLELIPGGAA